MSLFYRSPKVRVGKSQLGGKGIFARANIPQGELICAKSGFLVNRSQLRKVEKEFGDYWLQIDDNLFITPLLKKDVVFINHSCDPNVGISGDITFVALRDIRAGEELCYDYATGLTTEYRLECKCGSKFCRGIITGNDWKRKDLQERYGFSFAWFILKKIHRWD